MTVNATPEALRDLYNQISVIDSELALASDTATAGKRKTRNTIKDETAAEWNERVNSFVSWLTETAENNKRILVGALAGLDEATKKLTDEADELVDKIVKENTDTNSTAEKPSADRIAELSQNRRELNEKYKVLRSFLEMFDAASVVDVPKPEIMRGTPGKRGKNVFKSYDFFLSPASDEKPEDSKFEPRSENTNSISSIASTVANVTAAEFRNYLKTKGVNLETPDDSFVVQLSNGRWMKAVKRADNTENPNEPDETEEVEDITAEA